MLRRDEVPRVKFFEPSTDPAEGLGVLMLFRLIEESVGAFFQPDRPIHVTRAPGRLDVLGGRAPGADALTLQMPIAEGACVAIQPRADTLVRLWSPCRDGSRTQMLSMDLRDLGVPDRPIDAEEARALFLPDARDRWAGYLLGALLALVRGGRVMPTHGAELLLHSDIPEGAGVASSSAITLAALRAFARLYGVNLGDDEQVQACVQVERDFVAAPSRGADVRALLHAEPGELVMLQGERFVGSVPLPSDLEIVGLDSGVLPRGERGGDAGPSGDDALAQRFRSLLAAEPSLVKRTELGDQLFLAHAAYGTSGRGEAATDFLVEQAKLRRAAGGAVLGAKATGRGGGGTVVLLGEHGKVWYEALRIKKALLQHTGHSAHVFRWSSPGALSFDAIDLRPTAKG